MRFWIKFTSKDLCEYPRPVAHMSFVSEATRDEYWAAFWRGERGYKPLLWEAERSGGIVSRKVKGA